MLLRNLDAKRGMCNGTRLIISRMAKRVLESRKSLGEFKGEARVIPRATIDYSKSSGLPFTLSRLQFPVKLAFGMAINKSQGQSLQYVGIVLTNPVFSHGQLYVVYREDRTSGRCAWCSMAPYQIQGARHRISCLLLSYI